ncbi:MAG: HAD-IC family P-type ATPase [Candidatus Methanomethylophilaceae archaeon]
MKGLTTAEVQERRRQGLVNDSDVRTSRTYTDIIVKNAFTPFNIILFVIGALLLLLGNLVSALSATGIIIVNILISTVQEMRAKRRLDKIELLIRPKVTVIRDGVEVVIDQTDVVKDDLVVLRAGDQAMVDGIIEQCRSLEMDESLLTGESSTVRKEVGQTIYSGSICVIGEGYYTVTAFGDDSYASKMLSSAKKFTSKQTPLQMETGTVTKVLMALAFIMMGVAVVMEFFRGGTLSETLEVFVLCLDVVPVALFLLITLTYMIAAVRMSGSGVLLQRANSVESISHVDTVCMDKTGTITTNKLVFEQSFPFIDPSVAEHVASVFATTTGSRNRTVDTLISQYGESEAVLVEEVQFSSSRKFSAVRVEDSGDRYCIYSGAWNVIRPHIASPDAIDAIIRSESSKGLRTIIICKAPDQPLYDGDNPIIPDLEPVSVIAIRDEVRPDCRDTIEVFLQNDMDLKVISGDDPVTVDALFSIADIPGERKIISGPELEEMSPEEREKAILETNIFGRMKPENKEEVIETLKRNGRYVAMIGDGVNDVKSLKSAQVGVALETGSGAARGVADMVLVKDNFAALPKALIEGRKTVTGMRDILKLYLTRNFALAMMMVIIYIFIGSLPMIPIQNTFYAFVSVTIAAFFMTFISKPEVNKELILPDVLKFCIPSAIIISFFGLLAYGITWYLVGSGTLVIDWDHMAQFVPTELLEKNGGIIGFMSWADSSPEEICARSALVFTVSIAGILQLLLICPRFKFLSVDGRTNRSFIPLLIVAFLLFIIFAMYEFFPVIAVLLVKLALFPKVYFLFLLVLIAIWFFVELFMLKKQVLRKSTEKFEKIYMMKLQEEYTKGDVQEDD